MERLDKISKIELGFPYDFVASDFVHEPIFGKTFNRLDRRVR